MPKVETVYPPVRCLKVIPLVTFPQDCLTNFNRWWFCYETYEVVITDNDNRNILYIHDPIHLVNLSESDLQILYRHKFMYSDLEKEHAIPFEHVVHVCVLKGYHSGKLPLIA